MNHRPSLRSRALEQVFLQDVSLHSWSDLSLSPDEPPGSSHSTMLAGPGSTVGTVLAWRCYVPFTKHWLPSCRSTIQMDAADIVLRVLTVLRVPRVPRVPRVLRVLRVLRLTGSWSTP